MEEQEIHLRWDESVSEKLAKDGYDPKFGARPLRRLIQRTVEDTLSEELLQGHISLGQEVRLIVRDGEVALESAPAEAPAADGTTETESIPEKEPEMKEEE